MGFLAFGQSRFPVPEPTYNPGWEASDEAGGTAIGVWQPQEHQRFGLDSEHGAPAWHELHSSDHPAAVKFYSEAFGWDMHTMSDSAEFRFTTTGRVTMPGLD